VQAAKESGAKLIAMSALLTTTMMQMKVTIEAIKAAGLKDVKVIVGGAPVTADFASASVRTGTLPTQARSWGKSKSCWGSESHGSTKRREGKMVAQITGGAPIRRDRLIKALNHKEPDRVPIDIGSIGGGITNVAYYNLKDLLGIKGDEGTSLKANLTVEEFDERVLAALDVDIRHIGLRGPSRRTARVQQPDGSTVDEWGSFPAVSAITIRSLETPSGMHH